MALLGYRGKIWSKARSGAGAAVLAASLAVPAAVLGAAPQAAAEPPSIEAAASSRVISVGDTVRLNLRVAWGEGTDVKPLAVPDKIGSFVVKDISEGAASTAGDLTTREASLLLTSFETGGQTIPPISLIYSTSDGTTGRVETQPVDIEVRSVLPEDAKDIRDIKHPLRVAKRWKDLVLSYALLIGLAAGAAASILVSFKRREDIEAYFARIWRRIADPLRRLLLRLLVLLRLRRPGPARIFDILVDEPGLVPAEAALKELERIEALGLVGRKMIKEHYTLVSETLRRYLERQYGVLAMESPTAETLRVLADLDLDGRARLVLREVLEEADLVKFAKHIPEAGTIGSLLERARTTVRLTAAQVAVRSGPGGNGSTGEGGSGA
jgi:hypothetical protein